MVQCSIIVLSGTSGIGQIFAIPDSKVDVYNMNGVLLKNDCSLEDIMQLQSAIYILSQTNGKSTVFIKR